MPGRKDDRGMIIAAIVLSVVLFAIVFAFIAITSYVDKNHSDAQTSTTPYTVYDKDAGPTPYRMHYAYSWSEDDLVGGYSDEAAAARILLKANGLDIYNEGLASIGDEGDANAAISLAESLNRIVDTTYVAVPIAYDYIQFLPAPSIIWILEDSGEVRPVVFLCADEAQAEIADPRVGIVTYAFSDLSERYDGAMRQAVCLADRGYTALTG